jgi:hypothetical protein
VDEVLTEAETQDADSYQDFLTRVSSQSSILPAGQQGSRSGSGSPPALASAHASPLRAAFFILPPAPPQVAVCSNLRTPTDPKPEYSEK